MISPKKLNVIRYSIARLIVPHARISPCKFDTCSPAHDNNLGGQQNDPWPTVCRANLEARLGFSGMHQRFHEYLVVLRHKVYQAKVYIAICQVLLSCQPCKLSLSSENVSGHMP